MHKPKRRHIRQYVDIALNKAPLGDDTDRMAKRLQHPKTGAHDPLIPLHRLIGVGIGAKGDRCHVIALAPQGLIQNRRRIGPPNQPGFEIKPRRQAEPRMRGPSKTIDTAMFTAPIRINRTIKRHIRRGIARQNRACRLKPQFGAKRRAGFGNIPTIATGLPHKIKPSGPIAQNPTPAPPFGLYDGAIALFRLIHPSIREQIENNCKNPHLLYEEISHHTVHFDAISRSQHEPCRNYDSAFLSEFAFHGS